MKIFDMYSALQAGGHRFEPYTAHYLKLLQMLSLQEFFYCYLTQEQIIFAF
jgi:hypothetical protein